MDEKPLDQIMSDREPDAPLDDGSPPPGSPGERHAQPRDDHGRWASPQPPAAAPPDPPSQPQEQPPPAGYVPIQAMDARLGRYEERLAALQAQNAALVQQMTAATKPPAPAAPPPDFFDDPQAAFDHRVKEVVQPLQQQQQAIIEQFSSMMAVERHGFETVKGAYAALAEHVQANGPQDPTYVRIMRAQHPYGELVRWHQERQALATYGNDPKAYIEAEVARRLAEAQGQPPQPGGAPPPRGQPAPPMPSNLTGQANGGARSVAGFSGPLPLSQIMGR